MTWLLAFVPIAIVPEFLTRERPMRIFAAATVPTLALIAPVTPKRAG